MACIMSMLSFTFFFFLFALPFSDWRSSKRLLNFLKQIIMSKLMMTFICVQVSKSVSVFCSVNVLSLMLIFFTSSDRLATLLAKERSHSLTYIGCMKKGPVITDPKLKWYALFM